MQVFAQTGSIELRAGYAVRVYDVSCWLRVSMSELAVAAAPCPPPPPPVYDPPECPLPIKITSGVLSPGCYQNDCTYFGWAKLVDGVETGIRSIGQTVAAVNPYMQLDFGSTRSDISMIRLVARSDCCLVQSQNVDVYASATSDFTGSGSVLCQSNVTFAYLGEAVKVLCPVNVTMRYVTVQKITSTVPATGRRLQQTTSSVFSLQEVQALMDCEWS